MYIYGRRLGAFHGMSSQSQVSHCRVLPLGEFTVMIPEPHATLQGVIIPSAIVKIVFRHILFIFCFLLQFRLWRADAFVSSLIHLFSYSLVLASSSCIVFESLFLCLLNILKFLIYDFIVLCCICLKVICIFVFVSCYRLFVTRNTLFSSTDMRKYLAFVTTFLLLFICYLTHLCWWWWTKKSCFVLCCCTF